MSSTDDATSQSPPPRMRAAAKADSISVEDLVRLALEGRLRMPSFQRPFRWETTDRRKLLDSIYRGYPVGTLLLWKNPPTDAERGRPLDGADTNGSAGDRYLVVDGQQRLTTLWEALGRPPRPGETELVFDLDGEEVLARPLQQDELSGQSPTLVEGELPQVPLHLVLDAASLSAWVPQALSIEDRRRYFEIGKRIREYRLGLYVVEDADAETLLVVFDRINNSGKAMTRDEVFDALIGSRIRSDDAAGLDLVNARLADLGFGRIDPSTILKAFEAIRGDAVGRLDPRTLDLHTAQDGLLRTAAALRRAIEFLQGVAHIPHVTVSPYELPLVVLACFFARHPQPSERSQILLRRWLWRGSLGERLGGASGTMQQHVEDVTDDENASVQALLHRTGSPGGIQLDDWARTASAGMSSARGKTAVCALLSQRPRHLETGAVLEPSDLFRDDKPDFLRPILRQAQRGIVDRLLHPPGAVSNKRLVLECTDQAALLSHGIDEAAQRALRHGDANAFYQGRGELMRRSTLAFFERHAELERDDTASIASLVRRSA